MAKGDVTQIRIKGRLVGLAGLKEAITRLAGQKRDDGEIEETLLGEMAAKNYIPAAAREDYGKALLREFKRFIGEPVEEEPPAGLSVRILGSGCPRCEALERLVFALLSEMRLAAEVEMIKDPLQIARYGVLGTPALVINEKVRSVGSIPEKETIRMWLQEANDCDKHPR